MNQIVKEKSEGLIVIVHVALALLCMVSRYFFIAWLIVVVVGTIPALLRKRSRDETILYLSGYFFGVELIGRMIKASPILPYAVGNYFMLAIFPLGILAGSKKPRSSVGLFILLLCFPALFMIPTGQFWSFFINSFSGIVCLGLAAVYFSSQTYTKDQLIKFLKCIILPIITICVYVTLQAPDLSEIEFELSANSTTTGGFGSNQVSTVLGIGVCILLLQIIVKEPLLPIITYFSVALVLFFLFRGLLTFSRGGVIVALFSAFFSYMYYTVQVKRKLATSMVKVMFAGFAFFVVFQFTDNLTGGALTDRYKGETQGTKEGYRDKDLTTFTSNRSRLAEAEWRIFNDNPYIGVGPGAGYEEREKILGIRIASHTEVTRLLSEQGIPGLLIALLFLCFPIYKIYKSKHKLEVYYLIAFFTLAILTSFHSGMRTMITPLLWGVSCAKFQFPPISGRKLKHATSPYLKPESA